MTCKIAGRFGLRFRGKWEGGKKEETGRNEKALKGEANGDERTRRL